MRNLLRVLAIATLAAQVVPCCAIPAAAQTERHAAPASPPYRDATLAGFAPIADARVGSHIAAALPDAERDVMRAVMLALPAAERYNVVYFDLAAGMHANDASLLRIARSSKTAPHRAPAGAAPRPAAGTYSCANPPASTNTGAFRAVYSTCDTPYASADVYLPCRTNGDIFLNYPRNEAAFIYVGGFSGRGDAVDAGLQYSWMFDDWALFVNGTHGSASLNLALACNQTVPLEFYPASDTLLAVNVTGYTVYGQFANFTAAYAVTRSMGWSPACAGCVVKRVTSLAQTGDGFPSGSDGSYVGLNGAFGPSVRWSNAFVGFWNGRTPAGFDTHGWTGTFTGSYRNYPSDPNRVRVHFQDAANETDGLILQD